MAGSEQLLVRARALGLYARLLRVQRRTFSRDWQLINGTASGMERTTHWLAARARTRTEFEAGRAISDPKVRQQKLQEATEVCDFLERNVIQAELINGRPVGDASRPAYRLNFRPAIEINDGHLKGNVSKCC